MNFFLCEFRLVLVQYLKINLLFELIVYYHSSFRRYIINDLI
jgi:hypothetical protein